MTSPLSREDFINAIISELEVITASGPPPLTGPQVLKKMSFDFPELSIEEIRTLTAFLIESNGKTLIAVVSLTPTFKENLIYLANKTNDQQLDIALGELMAAVYIHLTLKMLLLDVSQTLRLFPGISSADMLCSNIQEHFCIPISNHLLKCLKNLSNGELLMKNLISLLDLLSQKPLNLEISSTLALMHSEINTILLSNMISQCLYIYRDVVTVYPELMVSSLPTISKAVLATGDTTDIHKTHQITMWLSLISSLAAAYAPNMLKRSLIAPSAFHSFKGFCYEHLDRIVEAASALLTGEHDGTRLQAVYGSLTRIGTVLASRDRSGLFHRSLTEEKVFGKLISSRLIAHLHNFAFDSELNNHSQDIRYDPVFNIGQ